MFPPLISHDADGIEELCMAISSSNIYNHCLMSPCDIENAFKISKNATVKDAYFLILSFWGRDDEFIPVASINFNCKFGSS